VSWKHVRLGVCARRIALGSVGTKATSLGTGRSDRAAWRIPSPHAPPTHIKPLEGIE
jgi:hypothetical protein